MQDTTQSQAEKEDLHISTSAEKEKNSPVSPKAHSWTSRWSTEDIMLLKEFIQAGRSVNFMAAHFNTSKANDPHDPDEERP